MHKHIHVQTPNGQEGSQVRTGRQNTHTIHDQTRAESKHRAVKGRVQGDVKEDKMTEKRKKERQYNEKKMRD